MRRCGWLAVIVLLPLWGCTAGVEAPEYQSLMIDPAPPDEALRAAQLLLEREFGHVRVEAAGRAARSDWAEFTTARDSGTARDLYGGRSQMRRMARLVIDTPGGRTVARLRVDVQRRDTARRAAVRPATGRFSDTSPGTPIDEDAALTDAQSEVWTPVRRDTGLERALLEELRDMFVPPAETPAP
jgi:hypothetical protein